MTHNDQEMATPKSATKRKAGSALPDKSYVDRRHKSQKESEHSQANTSPFSKDHHPPETSSSQDINTNHSPEKKQRLTVRTKPRAQPMTTQKSSVVQKHRQMEKRKSKEVASAKQDARELSPRNWEEVQYLQTALNPSILHFSLLTQRNPIPTSTWSSYNDQWRDLQDQLESFYGPQYRRTKETTLVRLGKWTGGIANELVATKLRKQTQVDDFNTRQPGQVKDPVKTLGWLERIEVSDLIDEANRDLGKALNREILPRLGEDEALFSDTPDDYQFFLCTEGIRIYRGEEKPGPWDIWCRREAPDWFRHFLHPSDLERTSNLFGFPGPVHDYPTVTWEQATSAHDLWQAQKRKGQSHTTQAARKSIMAIKGRNVFMGHPVNEDVAFSALPVELQRIFHAYDDEN